MEDHSHYAGVILQGLISVETDWNVCWHLTHASWLLHLKQWFSTKDDFAPTEDIRQYLGTFWLLQPEGGVEGATDI